MNDQFEEAVQGLSAWLGPRRPTTGLVLGSGLGGVTDLLQARRAIPFTEIPGLPLPAVAGHAGEFLCGAVAGREILVQRGRFHAYEGHGLATIALPVRLMARLGVTTLVLTNAAGGIHPNLDPGSLMLIADQVNLTFRNPLSGPVRSGETRFPDMSDAYDPALRRLAQEAARALRLRLEEGTYAGVAGPGYETPAEIRMLRRLGADAVGMSTVLEVAAARALGVHCLGVSIITNRAAGLGAGRLTHQEVLERARVAGNSLAHLLRRFLQRLN